MDSEYLILTEEEQRMRTMLIVEQLAQGKVLTLPNGVMIGMSPDMTIAPIIPSRTNDKMFFNFIGELTLKRLNDLLNVCGVVYNIPGNAPNLTDLDLMMSRIV